jgi:predicted nucleic acid-binding Zn ribbon protein
MCKITIKENEYPLCPECDHKMDKIWINAEGGFVLKGGGWFKNGGY